jgi:hypothetical protein
MSFRPNRFFYLAALTILISAGWACDKLSKNSAVLSDSQVVATVGAHQITFGDWMKQLDILRVFDTQVDPENSQQVKAVLETLINQELIIDAAQKANYSDPKFDEFLKNKLVQADIRLKEQKERLTKDMKALERVEKDYKDSYKKVLLARGFAANQVSKVEVSDRDLQAWYTQYSAQAAAAGQKMPPYSKVNSEIRKEIKQNVQAEKFLEQLQAGNKVNKNQDTIQKYLDSLSPSQQMLNEKAPEAEAPAPAKAKK